MIYHLNFPYSRVREITETFVQWLSENNLRFYRRLTGSYQCGQHLIIPVKWDQAYLLTGKLSVWEVYSRRKTVHLLSDSLRSTAELLSLAFCKEKPQYAKFITTRIFDAHSRYKRLLFDISTNTLHRGRRMNLCLLMKNIFSDIQKHLSQKLGRLHQTVPFLFCCKKTS